MPWRKPNALVKVIVNRTGNLAAYRHYLLSRIVAVDSFRWQHGRFLAHRTNALGRPAYESSAKRPLRTSRRSPQGSFWSSKGHVLHVCFALTRTEGKLPASGPKNCGKRLSYEARFSHPLPLATSMYSSHIRPRLVHARTCRAFRNARVEWQARLGFAMASLIWLRPMAGLPVFL
ncbi:MAG: hypothetical protein K0S56_847 [Microvirga sp.]|jgi:hypothetical protein|nr:hypothetical protein [Microvirga sp.]